MQEMLIVRGADSLSRSAVSGIIAAMKNKQFGSDSWLRKVIGGLISSFNATNDIINYTLMASYYATPGDKDA
jgi:hypothetical protein